MPDARILTFAAVSAAALALGGVPAGAADIPAGTPPRGGSCGDDPSDFWPSKYKDDKYTYFNRLPKFKPGTPLDADEMRVTFLGTDIPPVRRVQQEMSILVEVGWDAKASKPLDTFVFDMGAGVAANYGAAGIGFDRMDKVFICHLHGDHMSDMLHTYCFGPSAGRYSPLFIWGPGPSGVQYTDPAGKTYPLYGDGTRTFCENLRQALRWHSESFSFQNTSYASYKPPTKESWGLPCDPVPVGEGTPDADPPGDGYSIIPIELDWTKNGSGSTPDGRPDNIAYWNTATGAKVTHFPVIHCRKGSIGYKLEWKNPNDPAAPVRTFIYSSDTRPEWNCVTQAINNGQGVDIFAHETVVPPEVWTFKSMGLDAPPCPDSPSYRNFATGVNMAQMIQDSSHTPQGALGYLLSQINPRPRLTIPVHFPVADDTVQCAYLSVKAHWPDVGSYGKRIAWAFDLMVIRVRGSKIQQFKAAVNDFGWSPQVAVPSDLNTPKYWTYQKDADGNIVYKNGQPVKVGDPLAQIEWWKVIPATNPDGTVNYREDGY